MSPAPFKYHDSRTVSEALALLAGLGEEAKVLAGGQSPMPMMNMRLVRPPHLIRSCGPISVSTESSWESSVSAPTRI